MDSAIEERATKCAKYIIENNCTVRKAAAQFGISKSTLHKDVSQRLKGIDPTLYKDVRKILETNKAQRHIRGGQATRMKYRRIARVKKGEKEVKTCFRPFQEAE